MEIHPVVVDDKIRERAIAIFTYLRDLAQLRTKPTRDVDDYPRVLWFADIPHEKGCHTIAWEPSSEESEADWLEIQRQPDTRPPSPPPLCTEWLEGVVLGEPSDEPSLRAEVSPSAAVTMDDGEKPRPQRRLEDFPEVLAAWSEYLTREWRPWRDQRGRLQEVHDAYARLFAINQDLKRLGEQFELVVGLGYLTWRHPSGYTVRRHILAAQAALDFDAARGAFTLRASADGARLALELDCIDPQDRFDLETQKAIEHQLASISENPWDREVVGEVLRKIVHTLSDRGQYTEVLDAHTSSDKAPVVSFAPALILRKRTTKSVIAALESIVANLSAGGVVPKGTARLCSEDNGVAIGQDAGGEGQSHDGTPAGELFPLPANEEQLEIVHKLERHDGVLVQGPPGTGKSHTIANLICHLLATGNRVLVTAQAPRALKVLQEKLPLEIVPLCVSVLGNDREALENLQNSVLGISSRWSNWNPRRAKEDIERLGAARIDATRTVSSLTKRIRDVRESETHTQSVADDAYTGTAQRIARRITKEAAELSWFKDTVPEDERLSFGADAFHDLRRAYQLIPPEKEAELSVWIPELSDLPSDGDFEALVVRERAIADQLEQQRDVIGTSAFHALEGVDEHKVRELLVIVDRYLNAEHALLVRPMPWIPEAVESVLREQDLPWKALADTTRSLLQGLQDRARAIDADEWQWPEGMDLARLRADASDLRAHLGAGRGFGIPGFRPEVVRRGNYLLTKVAVNGRSCGTAAALDDLLKVLQVLLAIRKTIVAWGGKVSVGGGLPSQNVAHLEEQLEALDAVIALGEIAKGALVSCGIIPGLNAPQWTDRSAVVALRDACAVVIQQGELRLISKEIDSIASEIRRRALESEPHPVASVLLASVERRDAADYRAAIVRTRELLKDRMLLVKRRQTEERLGEFVPLLLSDLAASPNDPVWDDRIPKIPKAWNWSRACSWLKQLEKDRHDGNAASQLREIVEKVGEITGELAAKRAWLHCFQRMTDSERQHLIAWQQAIKRIGKGTGKYAAKHRRDAQDHLNRCRGAIPAWIMPLHRVYETIPPQAEIFDVAIVDEASQCGPDALVITYLAKKIVIVGDDQQISPEAVGLDRQAVHHLITQHLSAVPHPDSFNVDGSLFAHGEIRYGNRIVLREHFRCMPEIIRFSNNLCYRGSPLIPLRRYPPARLRPVVSLHVEDGYADGSDSRVINRPEAERVVAAVVACARDPHYDDKTFGVISLQGEAQAQLIESMLVEELDSNEIEERRLICGDAYSFQGDERHVMFLSMVAAPNRRIGGLAKDADKRRFNVAASRAQDQMWLFHSVTLNDLGPTDMRHAFLKYCLHPEAVRADLPEISLEDLIERARDDRRDRAQRPKPFDSWFEVDVYLALVDRGYRVVPQYPTANYRIDLVLEGNGTHLAIECDGDEWHGAEAYDADSHRQRVLERCGWRFCRVLGSEFDANSILTIERIEREASKLGIKPCEIDASSAQPVDGYVPERASQRLAAVGDGHEPDLVVVPGTPASRALSLDESVDRPPATVVDSDSGRANESSSFGAQPFRLRREPGALFREEGPAEVSSRARRKQPGAAVGEADDELVSWAEGIQAATWFSLSHWAKVNGQLQPWLRRMLYDVGIRVSRGSPVSVKQARQAKRAYVTATAAGFDPAVVSKEQ